MTATPEVRSGAVIQVLPPRGTPATLRLLLKVGIPLTLAAFVATLASYHQPGLWQPQGLVSAALVAMLGGAGLGQIYAYHLTWDQPRVAAVAGVALLGLVSYVAYQLSVVAAYGWHYQHYIHNPWVRGWTFSLWETTLSVLCLWVCVLVPLVAAVIAVRRRRAASNARTAAKVAA